MDAHAPFAQLSHIHYMTNNPQAGGGAGVVSATTPRSHHSQQDMRLLANGGGGVLGLNASLPRHMAAARHGGVQESTLSHYSQPLANGHAGIRLTQDHFNHNGAVYAKPCDAMIGDAGYIHNNSHYSLPLDHDMPPSPTPTPPPPALPLRNGMTGLALVHGNTTGRRSFNSNNNNVATLSNNNHNGNGVIGVNNNNNNGSLRRYH